MVSQVEGLRRSLQALDLGPEFGALVAYCEGLAETIDEHPERATLWREYRPALEALLRAGEVAEDDGQAAFLQLVSTPVGDTAKAGKADARPGGRGDRQTVRSAADAVAGAGRPRRSRAAS